MQENGKVLLCIPTFPMFIFISTQNVVHDFQYISYFLDERFCTICCGNR
jgi:hypothetical protein